MDVRGLWCRRGRRPPCLDRCALRTRAIDYELASEEASRDPSVPAARIVKPSLRDTTKKPGVYSTIADGAGDRGCPEPAGDSVVPRRWSLPRQNNISELNLRREVVGRRTGSSSAATTGASQRDERVGTGELQPVQARGLRIREGRTRAAGTATASSRSFPLTGARPRETRGQEATRPPPRGPQRCRAGCRIAHQNYPVRCNRLRPVGPNGYEAQRP